MGLLSISLKLRNRHFLLMDLISFSLTPIVAMALRLDGLGNFLALGNSLVIITFVFLSIKLAIFFRAGLYKRYWRYASIDELTQITGLVLLALILQTIIFLLVLRPLGIISDDFPRSVPLIDGMLTLLAVGGIRYSVRVIERVQQRASKADSTPVLIVGAGDAGVLIVQEMQSYPKLGMRPVAFVDDADEKQGVRIRGITVLGKTKDIARVCRQTNARHVIVAMPTAPGSVIREIVSICEHAGISAKTIPGMYELLDGSVSVKQLRDIRIEDLLRREPVQTDFTNVNELLKGKRVLITGGGGSIGSELCRQVLRFGPESLIILGHGENSVFEIHNELTRWLEHGVSPIVENGLTHSADTQIQQSGKTNKLKSLTGDKTGRATAPKIHTVIADIRFADRIQAIFKEHQPEVVFHAAAHKHVPLMEVNPSEAITNNVMGTRNLLNAALAEGVEHFVMISTDKAVNPTSVMGASKRAAELLVHKAAIESGKPFVAVRFGNVLGSRGSVVLSFKQQIAAGGPVTVTHPEMMRYFMTIPEAVQLVLQAAPLGRGGEVFMLDMGEPIKIVDLARDIIELSGFEVGHDIDIVFSGLRPGEKLFEEMFFSGEEYDRTEHQKIFIARGASNFVPPMLNAQIGELESAAKEDRVDAIISCLQSVVAEFQPVRYTMQGVGKQVAQPPTSKRMRTEESDQSPKEQKAIDIGISTQWDHPAQPRFGLD